MFLFARFHFGYCIAVNSEMERTRYGAKYHMPLRKIVVLPDSYEWNGLPTQEELVRIRVEQRSVFAEDARVISKRCFLWLSSYLIIVLL